MKVSKYPSMMLDMLEVVLVVFLATLGPVVGGYLLIGSGGGIIGLVFGLCILLIYATEVDG